MQTLPTSEVPWMAARPDPAGLIDMVARVLYDTDEDMLDEILAIRVMPEQLHDFDIRHPRLGWIELDGGVRDRYIRLARAAIAALAPQDAIFTSV